MTRRRILIVEDEGIAAMNLEGKIDEMGYESAGVAQTGEEAVRKSRTEHPDLVLMDIKLKGTMDGIQAAGEIQKGLNIPVVFLSAFSDEVTIARAAQENPFGYLVKPLRDSSIRSTIEMALQKHQLEQMLHRTESELRSQGAELARSNQDLEQFTSIASHDLSSPLRHIRQFATLLEKECGQKLDSTGLEYLHTIKRSADKAIALINDLLEYSCVRKKPSSLKTVPLSDALESALNLLKADIEAKGASIECGPMPTVTGSRSQLERLFVNLISNAIKYVTTTPRIEISATKAGGEYLIRVRDNGIGIAEGQTSTIFEMFRRGHSESQFPGSGIGLSSCKRIVENHGGRIWVESRVGVGSTFCFTLSDPSSASSTPSDGDAPSDCLAR